MYACNIPTEQSSNSELGNRIYKTSVQALFHRIKRQVLDSVANKDAIMNKENGWTNENHYCLYSTNY